MAWHEATVGALRIRMDFFCFFFWGGGGGGGGWGYYSIIIKEPQGIVFVIIPIKDP